MKIAIYGSRRQQPYLPLIEEFLTTLAARGDKAVMHAKLFNHLQPLLPAEALQCVSRVVESPRFEADFAVSLGGDGSFLRTAAWVADKQIPIIGVNTGHLGFLASISVEELAQLPAQLADSANYEVESRSLLQVDCPGLRGWPYALNEATITKSESTSIIGVRARIDGVYLADYRADGLIIATPTGSTAYNLSVGGPIVEPTAPVWVLSPIAAHSLSMRPLVVGERSVLHFDCDSRGDTFRLTLDGRTTSLPIDTPVEMRRAPFVVNVVRMKAHNFADTLRAKLQWG